MTYYYFLARPRNDVATTITVTRFVPNSLGRQVRTVPFAVAVYTLHRRDGSWCLHDTVNFGESQHVTVSSEEIGLDVGDIAVALPVQPDAPPPARTQLLPAPATRTVDGSPVATRCSLRFHWSGVSSSYQSEYPLIMANRTNGPINSFNLSSFPQGRGASVLFCAVNITRDAGQSARDYSIHHVGHDGTPRGCTAPNARRNACTVIETDSIEAATRLAYASTDAVFLPIYITLSNSQHGPEMSVEHTHPPHEMFWRRPSQGFCMPKLRASWVPD